MNSPKPLKPLNPLKPGRNYLKERQVKKSQLLSFLDFALESSPLGRDLNPYVTESRAFNSWNA